MINFIRLAISILICQLAGFIGSIFTAPAITSWYENLKKPAFRPPNWLFAPVWTTLFLLMGISLYLIWSKGINKKTQIALIAFGVQLVLNILWSVFFFGLKNPLLAFLEIIILWLAIFINIIYFYRIEKIAAILLIPYILWVSFAAFLNFLIYKLNI